MISDIKRIYVKQAVQEMRSFLKEAGVTAIRFRRRRFDDGIVRTLMADTSDGRRAAISFAISPEL